MTETSGDIHGHCSTLTPHGKLTVQFDGLLGKVILKFPRALPFPCQAQIATSLLVMQGLLPHTSSSAINNIIFFPFAPSFG